jgi:mannitol/fructose-specific phosphotransferase system IIA component (Ntr-type)
MRALASLDIEADSREEAIGKAVPRECVSSVEGFLKDVMAREAISSTDVGNGIAIPHARSRSVRESFVSFVRLRTDVGGVRYFFLLGAKEDEEREYMRMLTRVARALLVDSFVEKLGSIKSASEFERALELAMEAVADE